MRERNERERLKKQQDYDDNMTEIANHIFGDTLTENPAVAQSAFGPHRVIPDRWKGMSPQQLEDIRREQEKQRLEKEVSIIFVINSQRKPKCRFVYFSYLAVYDDIKTW